MATSGRTNLSETISVGVAFVPGGDFLPQNISNRCFFGVTLPLGKWYRPAYHENDRNFHFSLLRSSAWHGNTSPDAATMGFDINFDRTWIRQYRAAQKMASGFSGGHRLLCVPTEVDSFPTFAFP
jgi:hypothetical protein